MAQIIKTLSIFPEQEQFLKENPELSLSKIVQVKINEIMEQKRSFSQEIIRLQRCNKQLTEYLQQANAEIEELKGGLNKK